MTASLGFGRPPGPRHFTRWEVDDKTSLTALMPAGLSRCGVYVCEFVNGEEYVGKGVHFTDRIAKHRRTWPRQIVAIRFAPIGTACLDQVERDTIAQQVAAGVTLRNTDLMNLPLRAGALDAVVDEAEQMAWLSGDETLVIPSDRADEARTRVALRGDPRRLAAHPRYDAVVEALAFYIGLCLPRADLTEGRFWVVTNMPSSLKSATYRRLAVVSVHKAETLVIYEWRRSKDDPWNVEGFINTALDTRVPRWASRRRMGYVSTGGATAVYFDNLDFVRDVLFDGKLDIRRGARELALGQLRKGTSLQARYHDQELADAVFIRIDDWNTAHAAWTPPEQDTLVPSLSQSTRPGAHRVPRARRIRAMGSYDVA